MSAASGVDDVPFWSTADRLIPKRQRRPAASSMNLPLTPLRFLERAQRLYGRKTAVLCGSERFTYSQLFDRVRRLAGSLCQMGLQPGDRVALLSYNCHRLLEAYYGVLQAKGVLLPLNIRLAPAEIAFILKDSGARFVFLDADFLPMVDGIRGQLDGVNRFVLLQADGAVPPWVVPHDYDELLRQSPPMEFDF